LRPEHQYEPSVSAQEAEAELGKRGRLCRERPERGPFAVERSGRAIALVAGGFRRAPAGAKSDSSCAAALGWTAAILKP
jgi:hypothetical protein